MLPLPRGHLLLRPGATLTWVGPTTKSLVPASNARRWRTPKNVLPSFRALRSDTPQHPRTRLEASVDVSDARSLARRRSQKWAVLQYVRQPEVGELSADEHESMLGDLIPFKLTVNGPAMTTLRDLTWVIILGVVAAPSVGAPIENLIRVDFIGFPTNDKYSPARLI
jgi:hypothetical protein